MPIAQLGVDAIVNAANTDLCGGNGVYGEIHRAAGPRLLEACRPLQGCEVGQVKVTSGYRLPARNVIHTVGPKSGESETYLGSCYLRALDAAAEQGSKSVAFPCISTGAGGLDAELAANMALSTVQRWLARSANNSALDEVVFALNSKGEEELYRQLWPSYFAETARPVDPREEPQHRQCRRTECGERYVGLQTRRCPRCDSGPGQNLTPGYRTEHVRTTTVEPEVELRMCTWHGCGHKYSGTRRTPCPRCGHARV